MLDKIIKTKMKKLPEINIKMSSKKQIK